MLPKIKISFTLLAVLLTSFTFAQDQQKYSSTIRVAYYLYLAKDYETAAQKYEEAFVGLDKGDPIPTDRYNAACAYSLAGNPDTAFLHLFRLVKDAKYGDYEHLSNDKALAPLHRDKRWPKLLTLVKNNNSKGGETYNPSLVAILETLNLSDPKDPANLAKVRKILDEHGWLGRNVIGNKGNLNLFWVIRHADDQTQSTYLPMLREGFKEGNAHGTQLALVEDKVALAKGKRQLYGTQIRQSRSNGYYVAPLADPDNVDKRRATLGLEPLSAYISNWDMTWDVKKYKKMMKQKEAKKN